MSAELHLDQQSLIPEVQDDPPSDAGMSSSPLISKALDVTRSEVTLAPLGDEGSPCGVEVFGFDPGDSYNLETVRTTTERQRQRRKHVRALTYVAIREGRLVPEPCLVCDSLDVQAHHFDYYQPLEVLWVCRTHHQMIHGRGTGGRTWRAEA